MTSLLRLSMIAAPIFASLGAFTFAVFSKDGAAWLLFVVYSFYAELLVATFSGLVALFIAIYFIPRFFTSTVNMLHSLPYYSFFEQFSIITFTFFAAFLSSLLFGITLTSSSFAAYIWYREFRYLDTNPITFSAISATRAFIKSGDFDSALATVRSHDQMFYQKALFETLHLRLEERHRVAKKFQTFAQYNFDANRFGTAFLILTGIDSFWPGSRAAAALKEPLLQEYSQNRHVYLKVHKLCQSASLSTLTIFFKKKGNLYLDYSQENFYIPNTKDAPANSHPICNSPSNKFVFKTLSQQHRHERH